MSIAVSAVVRPSRVVLCLTVLMCLGSVLVGVLIGSNLLVPMAPLARSILAAGCALAALIAAYQTLCNRCVNYIDISGNGQIRVYVSKSLPSSFQDSRRLRHNTGSLQHLLPSSTLWSHLLILNLRSENGKTMTLLVLPDVMSESSFRALSVACHWIAAHNIRPEGDVK